LSPEAPDGRNGKLARSHVHGGAKQVDGASTINSELAATIWWRGHTTW